MFDYNVVETEVSNLETMIKILQGLKLKPVHHSFLEPNGWGEIEKMIYESEQFKGFGVI